MAAWFAGFKRCWCSCWPHKSTVAPSCSASWRTVDMEPSMLTRLRPSAETLRHAMWPSSALSASADKKKRPSTTAPCAPSRTVEASARSPTSSLIAESSAVLPAPVSPVTTVRPCAGANVASRIRATFCTWSSSSMAKPFSNVPPHAATVRCRPL